MINQTNTVFQEYPPLQKNDHIRCMIESCDIFKGTTLLIDNTGKKFSVKAYSNDVTPSSLYNYCEKGDSLVRPGGSLSLTLVKSKEEVKHEFEIVFID